MIPGPTGTYTYWDWPASPGFASFEWTVTPRTDPTPDGYFWSHQFWLVGGPAGYCGLQTVGSEPSGKIAIFSIWDAVGAEGPEFVAPFTGEGDGFSVRIRWPWLVGQTYRLRVASGGPHLWSAWVDGHAIGTIRVPAAWGGLSATSVMWTERYSGRLRRLSDIRRSETVFGTPVADGAIAPVGHRNVLADPPGSPGSCIEDMAGGLPGSLPGSLPGGVVQVMGGGG